MPEIGAPGTCVELFDSADADFDFGSGTAKRLFLVGQLVVLPAVAGFPSLGQEHPRYPGLFCDRFGVQEIVTNGGAGVTKQYALYSNNGRFTTEPDRPAVDLERGYLRIDPERGTMELPFLVATARLIPIYEDDVDSGRKFLVDTGRGWEWVNQPRKFQYYRTVWSRSVDVLNLNASERDYITAQTGQIHTFPDNKPYMMLAPVITQKSPPPDAVFSIAYQWITEPTLPVPGYPPFPGTPGGPTFTPPVSEPVLSSFYVSATQSRPPFFEYQVVPGFVEYSDIDTMARISIPKVYVVDGFPDKRSTPTGWVALPGDPIGDL